MEHMEQLNPYGSLCWNKCSKACHGHAKICPMHNFGDSLAYSNCPEGVNRTQVGQYVTSTPTVLARGKGRTSPKMQASEQELGPDASIRTWYSNYAIFNLFPHEYKMNITCNRMCDGLWHNNAGMKWNWIQSRDSFAFILDNNLTLYNVMRQPVAEVQL